MAADSGEPTVTHPLVGPLDLKALWAVLDGRAKPGFESIEHQTKTMKIALDIGAADISIRSRRFSMQWKGRGRSAYWPRLAPPVVADLMKRVGADSVQNDLVAWMPSATVPGHAGLPAFVSPSYVVWFVRLKDGLDVFTRHAEKPGPSTPGPIPSSGSFKLPDPWSSPVWRTYLDFPEGLSCPHCETNNNRYRQVGGNALVCSACGRSFDP